MRKLKKVDGIFPIGNRTITETQFLEHFLDKKIDLESENCEEFVLSTKQIVFLLTAIMREYSTFIINGNKFKE